MCTKGKGAATESKIAGSPAEIINSSEGFQRDAQSHRPQITVSLKALAADITRESTKSSRFRIHLNSKQAEQWEFFTPGHTTYFVWIKLRAAGSFNESLAAI